LEPRHGIDDAFQLEYLGFAPSTIGLFRTVANAHTDRPCPVSQWTLVNGQKIILNVVHCFVPSSKAHTASSGYVYHPTFEVCHTKRHRYAIESTLAQQLVSRLSNAVASRARRQHVDHALHAPRYLTGFDCDSYSAHQCVHQRIDLLAAAQLVGV
jgi:hypothetical protein